MKPSEILSDPRFAFEIRDGANGKEFASWDMLVGRLVPNAGPGTVPLTNQCPLFVGTAHRPTEIVNAELPEGAKLPNTPGVYFLCDAINSMAYGKLHMTKEAIAEVVQRIEARFEAEGLNENGHRKK